jgi:hypothetical protein
LVVKTVEGFARKDKSIRMGAKALPRLVQQPQDKDFVLAFFDIAWGMVGVFYIFYVEAV